MNFCKIIAENIYFSYGKESIFKGFDLEIKSGEVLIIKGPNGSGKSTLIKLLSGILSAEKGDIRYLSNEKKIENFEHPFFFGLCTVEQNLYEEMTIFENLDFLMKLRGKKIKEKIEAYLEKANLIENKEKYYKNLSSGMRQRVKILSSFLHSPLFLFLDEPGNNLDEKGIEFLRQIIEEQKENGLCVIATNDERDFKYGTKTIELGK